MNYKIKIFIIFLIFLIIIILMPIIMNIKKVNIYERKNIELINSWIESEITIKWSKDWQILEKKENKNYFIQGRDQKGRILFLNCKPCDFYFYIKVKKFIYLDCIQLGLFDFLIRESIIFRIIYIIMIFLFLIILLFLIKIINCK